jgi:hypothetical protein
MREIYVDSARRVGGSSNSFVMYLSTPLINVSKAELVCAYANVSNTNSFYFLDIQELRRPYGIDAAGSVLRSNISTISNALSETITSFAMIPGSQSYFKESQDYKISVEYPSLITKIDRLTFRYLDSYSNLYPVTGATQTLLRFYSKDSDDYKPELDDSPEKLPTPVTPTIQTYLGAFFIGLVFILFFIRKKR